MNTKTLFATILLAGGIVGAATPEQLQRDIDRLQKDIESEEQLLKSDLARYQAWQASAKDRETTVRGQLSRALREVDSLEREMGSMIREREAEQTARENAQKSLEAFARAVADQVDVVLARLRERELPTTVESREQALSDIARGLRSGLTSPEEGLSRALDQVAGLIDMGGQVEARPGQYNTQAGLPVSGNFVRAGGFFEAFVSDDMKVGAYRVRGESGWVWKETLSADGKKQVAKAASILKSTQSPEFVALPFGLAAGE